MNIKETEIPKRTEAKYGELFEALDSLKSDSAISVETEDPNLIRSRIGIEYGSGVFSTSYNRGKQELRIWRK